MSGGSTRRVFGPVWSHRLGRSLGIDLVPFKTCTFDCIYCQLGRTTRKTARRLEYVPLPEVIAEIERKLESGPAPDYLTLSGSGEPTLHRHLGKLVSELRRRTALPIAVITNGSLLWDPEVRDDLLEADLVLPSLDAGEASLYEHVNHPLPQLTFDRVVEGLRAFRAESTGAIWLEVFLLGGITALPGPVDDLARIVARLRPDRVQINAVARPPTEDFAFPVPIETLRSLAGRFEGRVDVVADMAAPEPEAGPTSPSDPELIALLQRRPVTVDDIAMGLGWSHNEVVKRLDALERTGVIGSQRVRGNVYFRVAGKRTV